MRSQCLWRARRPTAVHRVSGDLQYQLLAIKEIRFRRELLLVNWEGCCACTGSDAPKNNRDCHPVP